MKQVMVNGLWVFRGSEGLCRDFAAALIRQVRDMYRRAADQGNAEYLAGRMERGELTNVRVSVYDIRITDYTAVETQEL